MEILQLGTSRTIFNKLSEENQIENIVFDSFGNAKANEELKIFISNQKGIEKFELEQYFIYTHLSKESGQHFEIFFVNSR